MENGWNEEQICTLQFDEPGKVLSYVISTQGAPDTCVMLAMDKKAEDYV
jgi:hypothetical protein